MPGVQAVREGLTKLIKRYPDRRFLLMNPRPTLLCSAEPSRRVPHGMAARSIRRCVGTNSRKRLRPIRGAVSALETLPNARLLDLSSRVCDGKICRGFLDGKPAFSDDNHIAYSTARLFTDDFLAFLSEPAAEPVGPALGEPVAGAGSVGPAASSEPIAGSVGSTTSGEPAVEHLVGPASSIKPGG